MEQIKELYKRAVRKLDRVWTQKRVKILWPIVTHIPGWKGIEKKEDETVIVSLTSFPARIGTVSETVKSLLLQEKKPTQVILWLAEEQFPRKEKDLPPKLMQLRNFGLKICWCKDIRSYKKLIPALERFPEAIIVTADDDLYYRANWLKVLYNEHQRHTQYICVHRITKFYIAQGQYETIEGGHDTWPCPSFLNKLTGGSGALYPPHVLHEDIVNFDVFMDICPTNDDIWFWLMAVLNGTKICVPDTGKNNLDLVYVPGTQEGPTLTSINDRGEMLFWKDFGRVLARYPELDAILKREYEQLTSKGPVQ